MKKETRRVTVESFEHGLRLDKFLADALRGEYSRQKIQDYIKEGEVAVNEEVQTVAKLSVQTGDIICIRVPVLVTQLTPQSVDFDVLYHDAHMAIINKPVGLVVHPETETGLPHTGAPTLAHGLLARFPELAHEETLRPGIVHRLDKDTSGILVVGLSEEGRKRLKKLFAEREIHKEYLALVHGVPEQVEGVIDFPIGRHPQKKTSMSVMADGKEALSFYEVLYASADDAFSLLAVTIVTGRTHQIRVHLSAIGHPIIGDTVYTAKDSVVEATLSTPMAALRKKKHQEQAIEEGRDLAALRIERQMLHAWRLNIPYESDGVILQTDAVQCADGELEAVCPPPQDFIESLAMLEHTTLRVVVTGMPGSGKSCFTQFLHNLGVPTFSADACVQELYKVNGDGSRLLEMRFGDTFVCDGKVDKESLGAAMRESDALRREIEDMIHPLVYHALNMFWKEHREAPVAVAEIPLFFESGGGDVDRVIGISCPFGARAKRLRETRGWSEAVITSMEAWQLPEHEKMARCDMVVANDGDVASLERQAQAVYAELMGEYKKRVDERVEDICATWSLDNTAE